jgi:hypothetical protein
MKKKSLRLGFVLIVLFILGSNSYAQKIKADGKFGLSFLSGGGSSSTGVLFGGALDIPLNQGFYVRPELNITSNNDTPIEMAGEIKYLIPSPNLSPTLYLDGGLGIWFFTGGPYFGLDFGGGAIFPITGSNLEIPAEIRLGPIFASGSTVFQVALTSGIRFSLP